MYRIGELASLANVSKRTIDYYTQLGLLDVTRSESNYRYYTEKTVEQLKLIEQYKKQHLSLEEIKERLKLVHEKDMVKIEKLFEKIDQLTQQMKDLESEILKIKPYLEGLNEQQMKVVMKHLSNQGMSFVNVLMILLGSL
ncbi:MerR family transcriptional regulator [Tepidibacillus fermentans]|uniref:MerR family transcriptional regulator n=1 Tax=Tepidibacillus fermentans TaxID=1281767 RepID=A0A4R3K4Z0_9BACI|nr:MerR family transcriptional regulator [Tepidibacillus fermentans]TCS77836.1 MerR family transcriptional regulator [Tepidibacillus fermentans]